jgi:hypothetical protein
MGAFFFYNKSTVVDKNSIISHFENLGMTEFKEFKLLDFNLILFKKAQIDVENYLETDLGTIFSTGSIVYKTYSYQESLNNILMDYAAGKLNLDEVRGNYFLFLRLKESKTVIFLTDPLFTKNIYYDPINQIISSHFLAIAEAKPFYYKLNYLALYESVISGSLIAPDTYMQGVEKLCKANIESFISTFKFESLQVDLSEKHRHFKTFSDAVDHANEQLKQYFNSLSSLDKEFNSHLGLTGGYDSRLLLIHARGHLSNLNTNSFFRPNSREYQIAKELAMAVGLQFKSHENSGISPASNSKKAFLFLDGQIRSQNFIDEPFNLPDYGEFLYSGHPVGFHGCGGEQYRNADRFRRKVGFADFIRNEWLFRESGDIIRKSSLELDLISNIEDKIRKNLNFSGHNVDFFLLKRIQNELWNTANRLTRVNALNQQYFYFAPFTEWQQSVFAYSYIDYLGVSSNFQIEMMKRIGKVELDISTTYGHSITQGIGKKSRIISNIASYVPRKFLLEAHWLFRNYKINGERSFRQDKNFSSLYNSIQLNKVLENPNTSHNLKALNTLAINLKLTY